MVAVDFFGVKGVHANMYIYHTRIAQTSTYMLYIHACICIFTFIVICMDVSFQGDDEEEDEEEVDEEAEDSPIPAPVPAAPVDRVRALPAARIPEISDAPTLQISDAQNLEISDAPNLEIPHAPNLEIPHAENPESPVNRSREVPSASNPGPGHAELVDLGSDSEASRNPEAALMRKVRVPLDEPVGDRDKVSKRLERLNNLRIQMDEARRAISNEFLRLV